MKIRNSEVKFILYGMEKLEIKDLDKTAFIYATITLY